MSWRRLPLRQQKCAWGLESLGGTDSSPRCSSRNFQQRWRLAQASSFVDRLAQIARGNTSHEMRSLLDFFATAQSFLGSSFQSVQQNGAHSSHSSCWPWRPARVRTLQGKVESLMARRPFEVPESVIGRPKVTSSWTSFTTTHTGSMLPTTLFEVAESVIGRPQNTNSWTGSEAELRDAVCVGVLRNSIFIP